MSLTTMKGHAHVHAPGGGQLHQASASTPAARSCLAIMAWAEVNAAVHAFGHRCLRPENRCEGNNRHG